MKYSIAIILILLAVLFENNYININTINKNIHIESYINIPYLWIYIVDIDNAVFWKSFYSRKTNQDIPDYIKLAIKTIKKHNKELCNIQILNNNNINLFLRECPFNINNININKNIKLEYIKYYLLYNYGGIWVDSDIIVFKNFSEIIEKTNKYNLVTFMGKNTLDTSIIGAKKYNPIIKDLLDYTIVNSKRLNSFTNKSKQIIEKAHDKGLVFVFSYEYNSSVDYNKNPIKIDNLVSQNNTYLLNPNKAIYIKLYSDNIQKYKKYNWLIRLSAKQIFESNIWLSKLLTYGLDMKQTYCNTESISNFKLNTICYDSCPKTKDEINNTIQQSNIIYGNPYSIINKQSYR